jgi:hypothetical protein
VLWSFTSQDRSSSPAHSGGGSQQESGLDSSRSGSRGRRYAYVLTEDGVRIHDLNV